MTQPFDVAAFQSQLTTASFGRDLRFHPSVGSTMDVARDAARNGAAEGTLVAADEQTAGRGRLGRTWVTPPAVNLASTLLLAGDGSNRAYPQIGIPEGHHFCTHHRNNEDLMSKVGKIDLYYMQHFARFLAKLEAKKDTDGHSILHNSMIVYGSGNSDGNRHTHHNLPIVLAGNGGGTLTPGRFMQMGGVPMSNLFLSLTDRMGVSGLERIGDSSGRVKTV